MRLLLILLLSLASPAYAVTAQECYQIQTSGGTGDCFTEVYGEQDAALNEAYTAVVLRARQLKADMNGWRGSDEVEAQIVSAQKAWVEWREKECEAQTNLLHTGERFNGIEKTMCDLKLIEERIAMLKQLAAAN